MNYENWKCPRAKCGNLRNKYCRCGSVNKLWENWFVFERKKSKSRQATGSDSGPENRRVRCKQKMGIMRQREAVHSGWVAAPPPPSPPSRAVNVSINTIPAIRSTLFTINAAEAYKNKLWEATALPARWVNRQHHSLHSQRPQFWPIVYTLLVLVPKVPDSGRSINGRWNLPATREKRKG